MINRLFLASLVLASAPLFADDIKFFNWDGFLAPQVIETFERETGHSVTQTFFDNEMQRDQIIISGRGSAFDLATIDHISAQQLQAQGYLSSTPPLNPAKSARFVEKFNEQCGSAGYPYAWGTMGIVYRESVSQTPINSWRQLFELPEEHKGRAVYYLDEIDTIAAALFAIEADPFTRNKNHLKQAFDLMLQAKEQRLGTGYLASDGVYNAYPKASIALGYSGDEFYLNHYSAYDDWKYVVPDEGTLLWVECLAMPNGKQLKAATIEFIEYISQPSVAAINAEKAGFASPVKGVAEIASESHLGGQSFYPSQDILDKSQVYKVMEFETLQLRAKMLDQFY
jgi:spermidine/putrescine-binding protein